MAMGDSALLDPYRGEHVAAKAFCKTQTFAVACRFDGPRDRTIRHPRNYLVHERKALFDLANTNPDTRIDVAIRQHGNSELQLIVGRVAKRFAHIEVTAAGATYIARRAEFPGVVGANNAGRNRAILQRGRVVIELDQARKRCRKILSASRRIAVASRPTSAATPPGITRSIIRRCPQQASAARSTCSRKRPQCVCMIANDASLQMAPISPKWFANRSSSAISARK